MTDGRWELLRALGAVADSPAAAGAVAPSLGLDVPAAAEHTEVFVLNTPPYASVYVGPEGALGGEGTDRAAGFWRALALTPPAEPDHLAALLSLYAHLGQARADTRRPATAAALTRLRAALLSEHLWPWLPAYLDAVTDVAGPARPPGPPWPAGPSPPNTVTSPRRRGWPWRCGRHRPRSRPRAGSAT